MTKLFASILLMLLTIPAAAEGAWGGWGLSAAASYNTWTFDGNQSATDSGAGWMLPELFLFVYNPSDDGGVYIKTDWAAWSIPFKGPLQKTTKGTQSTTLTTIPSYMHYTSDGFAFLFPKIQFGAVFGESELLRWGGGVYFAEPYGYNLPEDNSPAGVTFYSEDLGVQFQAFSDLENQGLPVLLTAGATVGPSFFNNQEDFFKGLFWVADASAMLRAGEWFPTLTAAWEHHELHYLYGKSGVFNDVVFKIAVQYSPSAGGEH